MKEIMEENVLTLEFPVASFRKLPNPYSSKTEEGGDAARAELYVVICDVKDLPDNIPMGTNPREQNLNTSVAKRIKESLLATDASNFFILNRGILLSAGSAHFNNHNNRLTLRMSEADCHGNVDGGHTYKTILEHRDQIDPGVQFVKLEILTGVEGFFEDVADARNTSVQVKDQSIAELRKRFEIIKTQIANEPYFKQVSFKENDEGAIEVCDLLAILRMFDVDCYPDSNSFPTGAYAGKAAHIKYYLKKYEEFQDTDMNPFVKLQPLMKDIFDLYDYLECNMDDYYRRNNSNGRYGSVKGVNVSKNGKPFLSKFSQKELLYSTPKSFLMPILGSLRALVDDQQGVYSWKADPFEMLDKVGPALVQTTIDRSRSLGNNPNATGKDLGNWKMLYQTVRLALLESLAE